MCNKSRSSTRLRIQEYIIAVVIGECVSINHETWKVHSTHDTLCNIIPSVARFMRQHVEKNLHDIYIHPITPVLIDFPLLDPLQIWIYTGYALSNWCIYSFWVCLGCWKRQLRNVSAASQTLPTTKRQCVMNDGDVCLPMNTDVVRG